MDIYTSKESRSITRIGERILILFCEKGIVVPFKDASGQGSQRLFSFENLVEIMIAMQMWRFKMSLRFIKEVLDLWRNPELFQPKTSHQYNFDVKEPDVIVIRHFDSEYTGMAIGRKESFVGSFFNGTWTEKCAWILIAGNDPRENWGKRMTAFSTMLIDVGTVREALKKSTLGK